VETISQGLKPRFVGWVDVRAEARTYLRNNGNSNGKSRFPAGMTTKRGNGKSNRRSLAPSAEPAGMTNKGATAKAKDFVERLFL